MMVQKNRAYVLDKSCAWFWEIMLMFWISHAHGFRKSCACFGQVMRMVLGTHVKTLPATSPRNDATIHIYDIIGHCVGQARNDSVSTYFMCTVKKIL